MHELGQPSPFFPLHGQSSPEEIFAIVSLLKEDVLLHLANLEIFDNRLGTVLERPFILKSDLR